MKNKFKNKDKVFVYGPGENAGKFYKKQPAFIIERDSYYENLMQENIKNTEKEKSQRKYKKKGVKVI